jgi:hypothetical protein
VLEMGLEPSANLTIKKTFGYKIGYKRRYYWNLSLSLFFELQYKLNNMRIFFHIIWQNNLGTT